MGKGQAAESAAPLVPPQPTLARLREAAAGCKACDLWERGTQTVFGAGTRTQRFVDDLKKVAKVLRRSCRP